MKTTIIYPNFMWLLSGIVLWCLSLTDNDALLLTCCGHHLTMVTRGKVFLLTNQSISLVKSTMAGIGTTKCVFNKSKKQAHISKMP